MHKYFLNIYLIFSALFCSAIPFYPYQFKQLTVNNGLSNNSINSILRDSKGYMWFGTLGGLNRFDGTNFKVFRPDYRDQYALPNNDILQIQEDAYYRFWIKTRDAYLLFDASVERFYTQLNPFLMEMGLSGIEIKSIFIDSNKNYWICSKQNQMFFVDHKTLKRTGINLYDQHKLILSGELAFGQDHAGNIWLVSGDGCIASIDLESRQVKKVDRSHQAKSSHTWKFFIDYDNDIWMWNASEKGVIKYCTSNATSERFHAEYTKGALSNNAVINVSQGFDSLIWISTDHGGINLLNKTTRDVTVLKNTPNVGSSLAGNTSANIYCDPEGIMWVGTFKQGISYYHPNLIKFPLIQHQFGEAGLPYNDINCFAEDKIGNIWIGTNGDGLIYYDRSNNSFKQFKHQQNNANSLSGNVIVDLKIDQKGILWIGTYLTGLNSYDGVHFKRYLNNKQDSTSLGDFSVWHIFEDSKQRLWIGTLWGGLDLLDRDKNQFKHEGVNAITGDFVPVITEDHDGDLWVGGYKGVSIRSAKTGTFTNIHKKDISSNHPKTKSLSNNAVLDVYCDSRGLIWIATNDGLNYCDKETDEINVLTIDDGLCSNSIVSILEDQFNNLWVSTPNGISNLIVSKDSSGVYRFVCHNYNENDGLQARAFNLNSAFKTSKGELLFGGSKGFNIIQPDILYNHIPLPKVKFAELYLFNSPVKVGQTFNGRTLLPKILNDLDQLVLNYDEKVFAIQIAAPQFISPEKIHYRYQLEGFSTQWLLLNKQDNRIDFTNLDAGKYILRVKLSVDGINWKEDSNKLTIIIKPIIWWSWGAKLIYALLFLILSLVSIVILNRRRTARELKQKELFKQQQQKEYDKLKQRFLANVSHDFRTPLTLIMIPLELLIASHNEQNLQQKLLLMYRNAKQLLNLANQFLDISEADEGLLKLRMESGDLILALNDIGYSFSSLIEDKQIDFKFKSDITHLIVVFDRDKLEKIIYNLLSNAFKFTPNGKSICLEVSHKIKENNQEVDVQIAIIDSGIGISESDQQKIFGRFYQVTNQTAKGNGIGLSITLEFVKLLGGSIQVFSKLGEGSKFVLDLTFTLAEQREQIDKPLLLEENTTTSNDEISETTEVEEVNRKPVEKIKPVLLLVDDDKDLLFYLHNQLNDLYTIIEASNGKEGWQRIIESIPDVVVSDVNMPEMDGISLCKKLKADSFSSHIPFILLSAQDTDQQHLAGLNGGADDYITKPFSFEVLQSRIAKQLQHRELIQNQFQQQIAVNPSLIKISSLDEQFVQKAINTVELHMDNAEFNVEELSKLLGMSRVYLYKKLLALTGKSPVEFIRILRLKRAAQLLAESQLNVSEVAYKTGFNSPKMFAKYFKIEFGVSPSEYKPTH